MPQMIFVNLPVRDLAASVAFYGSVGFNINLLQPVPPEVAKTFPQSATD